MESTRRDFLHASGIAAAALGVAGLNALAAEDEKPIPGFDETKTNTDTSTKWVQTSDRKLRVGIVGYGYCKFGAKFSFQDHPNVEVVAVSDLIAERRDGLAKECRCEKTYDSLEEMVKDDNIEAIFVATDAPSHARHCIEVMKHGKHVATAVPAVYGSLEDADAVYETVKTPGLTYTMFETTVFRNDAYLMRTIYNAGGLGNLVYTEGEYYHYMGRPLDSYKGWRVGLPPMWYPTHSTGYYVGVTGGSLTEVSCMGRPSIVKHLTPAGNTYKNPFGTEVGVFRTSEGGMARIAVSWDTPGWGGETGRVRGTRGSVDGKYKGKMKKLPNTRKPPLPPRVRAGGHGGSHGYLMHDFVMAIIEGRKPLVDIAWALNMSVAGVVAHKSALADGELMKIPQYKYPRGQGE